MGCKILEWAFQELEVLSPNEDEAGAVLLVLMKAKERGKRFHQGLQRRWCKRSMEHKIGLAIYSIILNIKSIASFVHVIFVFVPMRLNGVTHLWEKLSYSLNRNFVWWGHVGLGMGCPIPVCCLFVVCLLVPLVVCCFHAFVFLVNSPFYQKKKKGVRAVDCNNFW